MRVVLDTNIIVSAFLTALGAPGRIVAAWRAQRFELVVSPALLAEYEKALSYVRVRRRHGLSREQVAHHEVQAIREVALVVEPADVPAVIPDDPDNDQVLACALAGEVDYIVSGDPHILTLREYHGIRVLSPRAFVELLDATNE